MCVQWSVTPVLSHGAVLLPWLMGRRASRRTEGGGQGTQEASQQREAQTPPGTKHGPAIAMANVLGKAIYVAGIARQFKVDSCHACAEGDDTACSSHEKE